MAIPAGRARCVFRRGSGSVASRPSANAPENEIHCAHPAQRSAAAAAQPPGRFARRIVFPDQIAGEHHAARRFLFVKIPMAGFRPPGGSTREVADAPPRMQGSAPVAPRRRLTPTRPPRAARGSHRAPPPPGRSRRAGTPRGRRRHGSRPGGLLEPDTSRAQSTNPVRQTCPAEPHPHSICAG